MAAAALCLPFFALPQTALLNAGVSQHSSLVVVPVFVAMFVTCNALGGGIFWDEFGGLSSAQRLGYPLGLLLLVGGVLFLASKPPPPPAASKALPPTKSR